MDLKIRGVAEVRFSRNPIGSTFEIQSDSPQRLQTLLSYSATLIFHFFIFWTAGYEASTTIIFAS